MGGASRKWWRFRAFEGGVEKRALLLPRPGLPRGFSAGSSSCAELQPGCALFSRTRAELRAPFPPLRSARAMWGDGFCRIAHCIFSSAHITVRSTSIYDSTLHPFRFSAQFFFLAHLFSRPYV